MHILCLLHVHMSSMHVPCFPWAPHMCISQSSVYSHAPCLLQLPPHSSMCLHAPHDTGTYLSLPHAHMPPVTHVHTPVFLMFTCTLFSMGSMHAHTLSSVFTCPCLPHVPHTHILCHLHINMHPIFSRFLHPIFCLSDAHSYLTILAMSRACPPLHSHSLHITLTPTLCSHLYLHTDTLMNTLACHQPSCCQYTTDQHPVVSKCNSSEGWRFDVYKKHTQMCHMMHL